MVRGADSLCPYAAAHIAESLPMTLALVLLALALALGAFWLLRAGPAAPPAPAPLPLPAATPPAPPAAPVELPPRLPLHHAELIDPLLTRPLMDALRQLRRPSPAVLRLMAPDFVQHASSAELASVVVAEPAIAARVVAAANAPLYGLQQPVTSIGQATTFLGLNSVRQLCLQHLLADGFQPRDEAQQREFDRLWRASSIAGELCQQLAPPLRIAEPGMLVTLLVLSFLGRQAGAMLLPDVAGLDAMDAHQRALHEQRELGLASHELGHLLMRAWELPAVLADEARTLAALRFDPTLALPPGRAAPLTLAALCALLGERLAGGGTGTAPFYAPAQDPAPDMAALRHRLAQPPLDALAQELHTPAMLRLLSRLSQRL